MSLGLNAASSKEQAANAYKAAAAAYGAAAEAYLQAAKDCEEGNDVDVVLPVANGFNHSFAPAAAPTVPALPMLQSSAVPAAPYGASPYGARGGAYGAMYNQILGVQATPSSPGVEWMALQNTQLNQLMGYQAQSSPAVAAQSVGCGPSPPITARSSVPNRSPWLSPQLANRSSGQATPLPTASPPVVMYAPRIGGMPGGGAAIAQAMFSPREMAPPSLLVTPRPESVMARATPPLTYTGLPTPLPAASPPATPMVSQLLSAGLPHSTVAAIEAAVNAAAREPSLRELPMPAMTPVPTGLTTPGFAAMRFNGASPW